VKDDSGGDGGDAVPGHEDRAIDQARSDTARARREVAFAGRRSAPSASESLVDDREQTEMVIAAMKLLPVGEREAIALAYFGGLSYREVAKQLGISEGTIKSRIRSGLSRLRQILDTIEEET
jgi:RNA polymerase sigma-70 factor (ECF subfamily)